MNDDVTATQPTPPPAAHDASLASLVSGVISDAQRLVSQQIDLIRLELKDDLRRVVKGVAYIAGAAGLLAIGGLMLFFGLSFLLNYLFGWPDFAGFLVVGGVMMVVGGIFLALAIRKFSRAVPEQTLTALQENLQWKTNLK